MYAKKLLGILIATTLATAGTALASNPFGDSKPAIFEDTVGFIIEAPDNSNLEGFSVAVINGKGETVLVKESLGEQVVIDPLIDMPNGRYFCIVKTKIKVDPEMQAKLPGNLEFIIEETRSVFYVIDGRKASDEEYMNYRLNPQASSENESTGWLVSLGGLVVDFLIPSAHATDLTISDGTPQVYFDDTDTNIDTGQEKDWEFFGNGGPTSGFFRIRNAVGADTNTDVFLIDGDSTSSHTDQEDSIWIQESGNIELLGGGAVFDRSSNQLVIGSVTPSFDTTSLVDLELVDNQPYFSLTDSDTGTGMGFYVQEDMFYLEGNTGSSFPNVVGINVNAPDGSLNINDTGTVWLNGGGKIHVGSSDDPVGQFTITSADQPRFEMNNTTTGKRWRFSVASNKFAINNLDVAGTEFQVFDNGDMTILGILTENSDVNAKQNIVPVNSDDLLNRIAELPIAEWSYIDAPNERHIGPMAQDFHAAFGLGNTDKGIATLDSSGIALAGIKALKAENDRLSAENRALEARLEALENRQTQIIATLSILTDADKPLLTSFVQEN